MRLLVVSPSKVFWRGVHNALRGLKHTIVECESGVAGLKKLRNESFEMLLLDAGLREMTGLEFLEQFNLLVEEDKRCPLLYFSAHATLDEVLTAVEGGIDDFIVLPFDNEVIRKKLDRQVKRLDALEAQRRVEAFAHPDAMAFVPQPQVIPFDLLVSAGDIEKPVLALPPPLEPDDAADAPDDAATLRRMRYKRRAAIGT